MDHQFQKKGDEKLAIVARQFMPSRIERQLLTQVFYYLLTLDHDAERDTTKSNDHQVSEIASSFIEIDDANLIVRRAS
jgi:hypothetical protein